MTKEHLDAIRGRAEACASYRQSREVIAVNDDRLTLLAEVERLNTEVESKVAQNVALIGQNGRLQQEVERLTADPLPAAAWVREVERAAFRRGVAAMREAAAVWVADFCSFSKADRIRALPSPEDKP